MLRWTLLLCFGLWLVFVLGPDPAPPELEAVRAEPEVNADGVVAEVTLESGETWTIDRIVGVEEPEPEPELQVFETPAESDDGTASAEDPVAPEVGGLLYVTGTRVNLRAGPSTDDAVVTALTGGTAVERIAEASDGWLEIRDTETGAEGFMSGDFLSPDRP